MQTMFWQQDGGNAAVEYNIRWMNGLRGLRRDIRHCLAATQNSIHTYLFLLGRRRSCGRQPKVGVEQRTRPRHGALLIEEGHVQCDETRRIRECDDAVVINVERRLARKGSDQTAKEGEKAERPQVNENESERAFTCNRVSVCLKQISA
jgi:hypothetical protein